jgi:hypothetical protein
MEKNTVSKETNVKIHWEKVKSELEIFKLVINELNFTSTNLIDLKGEIDVLIDRTNNRLEGDFVNVKLK